jgi:hypothetical protein
MSGQGRCRKSLQQISTSYHRTPAPIDCDDLSPLQVGSVLSPQEHVKNQ